MKVVYPYETYLVHTEGTNKITHPRVCNIYLATEQPKPKKPSTKKAPAPTSPEPDPGYTIRYDLTQLEAAADFIFENNDSVSLWPERVTSAADVQRLIIDFIRLHAHQNMIRVKSGNANSWTGCVGTGGYMIIMTTDNDRTVDVEIFVDPAVSNKHSPLRTVSELFWPYHEKD